MSAIPGYWQNETSGVLRPVIEKYLEHKTLTPEELAIMRAYLRQWIGADGFTGKLADRLRRSVDSIYTTGDLYEWLRKADDAGIDPL